MLLATHLPLSFLPKALGVWVCPSDWWGASRRDMCPGTPGQFWVERPGPVAGCRPGGQHHCCQLSNLYLHFPARWAGDTHG